jgi:hypothetical protein
MRLSLPRMSGEAWPEGSYSGAGSCSQRRVSDCSPLPALGETPLRRLRNFAYESGTWGARALPPPGAGTLEEGRGGGEGAAEGIREVGRMS